MLMCHCCCLMKAHLCSFTVSSFPSQPPSTEPFTYERA